jgi:serine acetyltransferase
VSEALKAGEHVHRAVLGAILVTGDQTASHATAVGIPAAIVEDRRAGAQSLDHLSHG